LTTGYHDHLRVRDEFGYKVNDAMWEFFKRINVLDQKGKPTTYFGDPVWVYCQYRRAKKDTRPRDIIFAEGRKKVKGIQAQGVPLAIGYGQNYWDMPPELNREVLRLYKDAKLSVWSELQPDFIDSIPHSAVIKTTSRDRNDYIGHPESGERLSNSAMETLTGLCKKNQEQEPDVWIVISDGLNARAIMDSGHLAPYLEELRAKLEQAGYKVADDHVVTISGRVRAGYRCGEILFAGCRNSSAHKVLIHIIGERPGTGHHNFSAYFCAPLVRTWTQKGKVDHNIARVVSGISDTALTPVKAAGETVRILNKITGRPIA
jgi:ethanolamine ammonia-lyase large subunit